MKIIKVSTLSLTYFLFMCVAHVAGEFLIIQLLPNVKLNSLVKAYPSLKYRIQGKVNIGKFRAIYGNFDARFARLLSYSKMVSIHESLINLTHILFDFFSFSHFNILYLGN